MKIIKATLKVLAIAIGIAACFWMGELLYYFVMNTSGPLGLAAVGAVLVAVLVWEEVTRT